MFAVAKDSFVLQAEVSSADCGKGMAGSKKTCGNEKFNFFLTFPELARVQMVARIVRWSEDGAGMLKENLVGYNRYELGWRAT
ncbi:hypothetical protein [Rhizobium leguminosarum]